MSLEVAKMLKEKGYNELVGAFYTRGELYFCSLAVGKELIGYNQNGYRRLKDEHYSAPTLLEAMDWLEERKIRIELQYSDYYHLWYSTIKLPIVTITGMGYYADRNECKNEAIKKGLELL